MKKYKVVVSVRVSNFVEVEANSKDEAIEIATRDYYEGNILEDLNEHDYCSDVDVEFDYPED